MDWQWSYKYSGHPLYFGICSNHEEGTMYLYNRYITLGFRWPISVRIERPRKKVIHARVS